VRVRGAGRRRARGAALSGLGRHAEALEPYGRAVTLDPGDAAAHLGRRHALGTLGRAGEARDALEAAIRLDPS